VRHRLVSMRFIVVWFELRHRLVILGNLGLWKFAARLRIMGETTRR
jgi:hypothetical protein